MNARSLRWGILLVATGVMWLLVRSDVLTEDVFWRLLTLWPILLIAIGIEVIFRKSKASSLAYISPALVAVTILAVVFIDWQYANDDSDHGRARYHQELSPEVTALKAAVDLADFDVDISSTEGRSITARFDGSGRRPLFTYKVANGSGIFNVDAKDGFWRRWGSDDDFESFFEIDDNGYSNDRSCEVRIPNATPVDFTLSGEDGKAFLDLTDIALRTLSGDGEKIRVVLKVGSLEPLVTVNLGGEDSRLRIEAPQGAGLKVRGVGYESYLRSLGLEQKGDDFVTPGYDTLTPKIDLHLKDDLSGLSISYY